MASGITRRIQGTRGFLSRNVIISWRYMCYEMGCELRMCEAMLGYEGAELVEFDLIWLLKINVDSLS